MLSRNCASIISRLPFQHVHRHVRLVTIFKFTGASPTDSTSSAGSSRIP